jgi:small-conductance mechanosensitive channel
VLKHSHGMTALPRPTAQRRRRFACARSRRLVAAAILVTLGWTIAPARSAAESQPPGSALDERSLAALRDAAATATVDAPPAAIALSNREIVTLRATLLLRPPAARAAAAERTLAEIAGQGVPVAVSTRSLAGGEIVSVNSQDVLALIPADLDVAETRPLSQVASDTAARLQQALDEAVELRTIRRLLQAAGVSLLATLVLFGALRLLVRGHKALVKRATRAADRQLQRLPAGEIMRTSRMLVFLRVIVRLVSVSVAFVLIYSWLTFVLRRFPYTRPWGEALRGFLFERVTDLGRGILSALPDLFTVLLIVLLTRLVVRLFGLMFDEVERGRASIPGVYPETALPTRRLVTVLLWFFALALSYPYLPGAETDAFKGVSVFIGLMVSLGSSGIVNQVMSGLTLTYSRALRLGDFVRIGDVEGTVTHLGSLSTKVRTPRGEEVTIPNAVVVSTQTTNYSRFADSDGVLTPTSVTIGYDVPWRQVQALLLLAAARTDGVRNQPQPVVRQTALKDFYVEYTLLVSLEQPALRLPTMDRLHGNIQDAFNEHGVQIMSPNYEADPEGPKIVPRERWFASPATTSAGER